MSAAFIKIEVHDDFSIRFFAYIVLLIIYYDIFSIKLGK